MTQAPAAAEPARRVWDVPVIALVCVAGLIARLWPRGPLWLDEAQSVAIARLPLSQLTDGLRADGAPPLYYVLLHAWMKVFGDGAGAVRSLTVIIAGVFIVVLGATARWFAGRTAAAFAVALVASSSFAVRYSSEARMYSLVMVEATLAIWLVGLALEQPNRRRLVGIALTTAALLYTHYWSLYFIAMAGVLLVVATIRAGSARRRPSMAILGAIGAGGLLWLPWAPVFLDQSRRTATPWTRPASISSLYWDTFRVSRDDGFGTFMLFAVLVLAVCAVIYRARSEAGVERPVSRAALAALGAGTLVLAAVGGSASGSAYVGRYTSIAFPAALLLAAIGAAALRPRIVGGVLVAVLVTIGLVRSVDEVRTPRTRAPVLFDALSREAQPADVVVYCPDQLGPALSRLLRDDPRLAQMGQVVFPAGSTPQRVDWVDYADRYAAAAPDAFVAALLAEHPQSTVWLVWSGTYPATQPACLGLDAALAAARPKHREVIPDRQDIADHGALWEFRPAAS